MFGGKQDNIAVEILADGTLKLTTDTISSANHKLADELVEFIAKLAGGETTKEKRKDVKAHAHHHHGHTHTH